MPWASTYTTICSDTLFEYFEKEVRHTVGVATKFLANHGLSVTFTDPDPTDDDVNDLKSHVVQLASDKLYYMNRKLIEAFNFESDPVRVITVASEKYLEDINNELKRDIPSWTFIRDKFNKVESEFDRTYSDSELVDRMCELGIYNGS